MKNVLYFQSGGPTSVINASFYGVIKEFKNHKNEVDKLYGALYGIEGVINQNLVEIDKDLQEYDEIKNLNGAILGSSRLHLNNDFNDINYQKILETVKKFEIAYILVNGGNDSMDTADKLNKFFQVKKIETRVIGIPKTIDNDLVLTDHTPGFASSAKYVIRTIMEISLDINVYKKGRVTIVEIMGRDAGFLAGTSALANLYNLGPDLIYLPETPFEEDKFLNETNEIYKKKGHVLICVSEALKDKKGNYIVSGNSVDSFGHQQLGSISQYLDDLVTNKLNIKTRHIELSLPQRAASHYQSKVDLKEAIEVGQFALKSILKHQEGMVAIIRDSNTPYQVHYELVDLKDVANKVKHMPLNFINENKNNVTQDYINYILPLVDIDDIKIESGHLFLK